MGLGLGFGFFGIIFGMTFLLVIGVFIFVLVRGISQWNKNNHSPRLTVPATVVTKRSATYHHQTSRSTDYYVTFQVDSGDRMELSLSGSEYGLLAEGDRGQLTFQGTRFLHFERIY